MARAQLAKAPSERGMVLPTSEKTCQFPGCDEKFTGIGAAKYCDEHRKPMYRKIITAHKREQENREVFEVEKPEKSNMIVTHKHKKMTIETRVCPCGESFNIELHPGVEIYPKFCPTHRNPYRRERLLEQLKKENEND